MITVVHKEFGKKNTDESRAAEYITDLFRELDCDGSVLVISNLSLPGGEKVKDIDIVVLGYLNSYNVYPYHHTSNPQIDTLIVNSFCLTIELKRHKASDIVVNDLGTLEVVYNRMTHNVIEQSMNQRDSLRNVLKRYKRIEPFITNLIWLQQVEEDEIPNKKDGWNILFGDFDLDTLFSIAASYNKPKLDKLDSSKCLLFSFRKELLAKELSEAFDLFLSSKKVTDSLSRQKFEYITNRNEKVDIVSCDKLNILKGRAGTGKTIQLLKFAYQEVVENHKRCLLLTYNHALVSDIKRISVFCDFPDGTEEAFSVQTINSFFMGLLEVNGMPISFDSSSFEIEYEKGLKALISKDNLEISEKWDYLLIDEAQDCKTEEIQLWDRIYQDNQIVIADGVDQFVRSIKVTSWSNVFQTDYISEHQLLVSKRQKSNIVSFVNAFADKSGVSWHVDENPELNGGTVLITNNYNKDLHSRLERALIDNKNTMYDMLFLVDSTMGNDSWLPRVIAGMNALGIKIFNGAQYDNRTRYPIGTDECRLYNYNSCRGIEGWCVVCMNLDMLFLEKKRFSPYIEKRQFESEDERVDRVEREIYRWILMPLTRAIDTLVITLHDVNSPIGRILKELHEEMPDYVIWDCH